MDPFFFFTFSSLSSPPSLYKATSNLSWPNYFVRPAATPSPTPSLPAATQSRLSRDQWGWMIAACSCFSVAGCHFITDSFGHLVEPLIQQFNTNRATTGQSDSRCSFLFCCLLIVGLTVLLTLVLLSFMV